MELTFPSKVSATVAQPKPDSLDGDVLSAGSEQIDEINPVAIQAMAEEGIAESAHTY